MNKRLRKRIKELCEIEGLGKNEKVKRAQEILNDKKLKQRLCNQMPGLSFRDIDRVIGGMVQETQFEEDEEELKKIAPQKFEPEHYFKEFKTKKTKKKQDDTYTLEEMGALVAASNKPLVESNKVVDKKIDYDTYTLEEMAALVAGNYHPERFKRRRRRKKG